MRRVTFLCCTLLLGILLPASHADAKGPYGSISIGNWKGGAYTDDATGKFTHCSAGAVYNSGIYFMVGMDAAGAWMLGFAHQSWELQPSEAFAIDLTFDGQTKFHVFGAALNKIMVRVPMPSNSSLMLSFRKSKSMTALAKGNLFLFNLDSTAQLMPTLSNCVVQTKKNGIEKAGDFNVKAIPKVAKTPPPARVIENTKTAATAPLPAPERVDTKVGKSSFVRRVALVIGNGDYRSTSKLSNPVNDAADVTEALRKLNFEVVEGKDLDRRGMDNVIREFSRKLDRADLGLFFYAGHGLQVGGKNYLVPIDAKLERPGDLALDAVEVSTVLAQMEAEKRVNLVFLDACRDNPLARSLARSFGARSTPVGQGLASIQSAIGTMISYATQPNNIALDGMGRNSPFTGALLKHIGTPGADIGTVLRHVRADVVATTREQQVPWDHSSLIGEVVLAQ